MLREAQKLQRIELKEKRTDLKEKYDKKEEYIKKLSADKKQAYQIQNERQRLQQQDTKEELERMKGLKYQRAIKIMQKHQLKDKKLKEYKAMVAKGTKV